MATNIITSRFGGALSTRTASKYQYDYGQVLRFADIDLPEVYEVHFSTREFFGDAIKQLGNADGVPIPDELFWSDTARAIYAWVYLHHAEDDGETVYKVTIPLAQRSRPSDVEPTPVQQDVIEQAIAALQSATAETAASAAEAAESAGQAADSATDAQTARDAAVGAVEGIGQYATRAETAAGQAEDAAGRAETAAGSATTAAGAASQAAQKAGEAAERSADNAAGSASAAERSADDASGYAIAAAESAEDAAQAVQEMRTTTAAIIIDSASGDVVSVPDGADDLPMKSVKVSIEPKQDLHGYDKPWAAGAGKNLLEITRTETYTQRGITYVVNRDSNGVPVSVTCTGTSTENNSYCNLNYTPGILSIPKGTALKVSGGKDGVVVQACIPTASASARSQDGNASSPFTVSESAESSWVRVEVRNAGTTVNTTIYPMLVLATETDYTFEPYSNICPISGHDAVTVTVNSTDYTADLPVTVYGGTLDVVSGELVVDKVYALLNISDEWIEYSGSGADYQYRRNFTDRKFGSRAVIASSAFPVFASGLPLSIGWLNSNNSPYIGIIDSNNVLTLSGIREMASNNDIAIVYELATPTTYHLTPQEVRTLLGSNTVMSEAGSVSITYPCDTKRFILKVVS